MQLIFYFQFKRMCHDIIKHSINENIKELNIIARRFLHSAFSTIHIFHNPHFPHSSFSALRTPHSVLRKRSDSSDSDSVELMTPLTTPIFDFH